MQKIRILFPFVALTVLFAVIGAVPGAPQERSEASSPVFIDNGQKLNNAVGRGVALADFNGDGRLDAFVVNEAQPKGQGVVFFGDGSGAFAESGQRVDLPAAMKPVVFDIDGNGTPDVLTGRTVLLNDGRGRFVHDDARLVDADTAPLFQSRAADLDGDGRTDLFAIVWGESGAEGRIYLQDGEGRYRFIGPAIRSAGILSNVELGDVNGDGYPDAVTSGWKNTSDEPSPNHVFLNNGKGRFSDSGQSFDLGLAHSHGLAVGDLDGDKDMDFVLVAQAAPFARIYLNDGKGTFTAGRAIGTGGVEKAALADFDGDGDLDVYLACLGPDEIWTNDGRGSFADGNLRLGRDWSWELATGDFNGDGRPDVFIVNLGPGAANTLEPRFAEVWLNTTPMHR